MMRAFLIVISFILLSAANCRADPLNNLLDAQKVLDKEEVSVEYSEANSDELEGDPEAAKAHYRKIISYHTNIYNDPASDYLARLESVRQIAMLKIKCGDYQEAVDLLKGFLAQYPDNKPVSNTLAEALYFQAMDYVCKQGQFQKAVDNVNEILNMRNIDANWQPQMKFYMASLYQGKGDWQEALEWYQRIITDHPEYQNWPAVAHLSMAEYYMDTRDYKAAREHLTEIANKYSSSGWYKQAKTMLEGLPKQ